MGPLWCSELGKEYQDEDQLKQKNIWVNFMGIPEPSADRSEWYYHSEGQLIQIKEAQYSRPVRLMEYNLSMSPLQLYQTCMMNKLKS